jgi:hypothetical protein
MSKLFCSRVDENHDMAYEVRIRSVLSGDTGNSLDLGGLLYTGRRSVKNGKTRNETRIVATILSMQ